MTTEQEVKELLSRVDKSMIAEWREIFKLQNTVYIGETSRSELLAMLDALDAAIDAAMGAAPITRATESQESAEREARTQALYKHIYGTDAESPESAVKEAQWVSVPLEPTPAMQQAGVKELRNPYWQGVDYNRTCAIYRAMLATRDKPQPHEEG